MILRRIGEAVRRQDWFVVLVEVLVVIFGVFIGLQVDDWNQARQDREAEKRFLEQILLDLEQDQDILGFAKSYAQARAEFAVFVDEALDNPELAEANPGRFVVAVEQSAYTFFPVLYNHTFEELKSSGGLGLIRDKEVKNGLFRYYNQFAISAQWAESNLRVQERYNEAIMGVLTRAQTGSDPLDWQAGAEGVTPAEGLEARTRFLAHPGTRDWPTRLYKMQKFTEGLMDITLERNRGVHALISAYLEEQ